MGDNEACHLGEVEVLLDFLRRLITIHELGSAGRPLEITFVCLSVYHEALLWIIGERCHHSSSSSYFNEVGCLNRFASTLSLEDDSILSSPKFHDWMRAEYQLSLVRTVSSEHVALDRGTVRPDSGPKPLLDLVHRRFMSSISSGNILILGLSLLPLSGS